MELIKDLCTPAERYFKGMAIAFAIYGAGSMIALGFVKTLTEIHMCKKKTCKEYCSVEKRKDRMVNVLAISIGSFFAIAALNLALCHIY